MFFVRIVTENFMHPVGETGITSISKIEVQGPIPWLGAKVHEQHNLYRFLAV